MERIVVGIDGSEPSAEALRWAIAEARARSAKLEVVHAWHLPYVGGYPLTEAAFDPRIFEDAARQTLDTWADRADAEELPRPVHRTLVKGGAAEALLDAAEDADLIVIGSRGFGGFKGLLLGSVSQHVAHHATCPVVIVPLPGKSRPSPLPSASVEP